MPRIDQPAEYAIEIQGGADATLTDWFGPLKITERTGAGHPTTMLAGIFTDQAGLIGMIRHLHGLGIVILAVQRMVAKEESRETV